MPVQIRRLRGKLTAPTVCSPPQHEAQTLFELLQQEVVETPPGVSVVWRERDHLDGVLCLKMSLKFVTKKLEGQSLQEEELNSSRREAEGKVSILPSPFFCA